MKRLAAVLAVLAVLVPASAWATAGTCAQTTARLTGSVETITFTCTADSTNGSMPAISTAYPVTGFVFLATTNPGTTAPTDQYDMTLTDADGIDVFGGEVSNRHTSNSEAAVPKIGSSVYGARMVNSALTLNVTNNSVNSATFVVTIYVAQ